MGHAMRPPSVFRGLGIGQNQILSPAFSAGAQSRNVLFKEEIVKSVTRTTVVVTNCSSFDTTPFEMFDVDE